MCALSGKIAKRVARDVAIVAGPLDRVGDGVVALHQLLRIDEVVRRLVAVFERALPEIALFLRRRGDRTRTTGRVILPSRKSSPTLLPISACLPE